MREIKFRAWDIEKHIMVYDVSHIQREGLIVMQYTGRKDKSGVGIFDRDMLKFVGDEGDYYEEVFWSEQDAQWKIRDQFGSSALATANEDALVGGNIYENPELLETTNLKEAA